MFVDGRYALAGQKDHRRSRRLGDFPPDRGTQLGVFLHRGPHQRYGGIVLIEAAMLETLGHRVRRAEVDHVRGADRDDLRHPAPSGGGQPVGPGREDSADQFVGQLGRGDVQDPGDHALGDQRLHRLSSVARGVEDQHLEAGLFQHFAGLLDTRCRDAEHGGSDQRSVVNGRGHAMLDHPGHRGGGLAQNGSADAVQPRDIHDRIQHQDVLVTHVGSDLPRRQRADHQLRYSQGQSAHRRGADRGTGRSAQRQHAVDFAALEGGADQFRRAACGQRDRLAPISRIRHSLPIGARRLEHRLARHIGGPRRLPQTTGIDHRDLNAQLLQPVPHQAGLVTLGIQGCQQKHAHCPHSSFPETRKLR